MVMFISKFNNFSMKNTNRGFTLIELLVVIAIIGILASVVLVSLNSARSKGKDTRVISSVNQIRTLLETNYNGSSYPDLGNNATTSGPGVATLKTLTDDIYAQGASITIKTNGATATMYALFGSLPSQAANTYFCIDSTGRSLQTVSTTTPGLSCQ
jgi:prepilin-type N-terminal cleavage/methylation domain-containing protein